MVTLLNPEVAAKYTTQAEQNDTDVAVPIRDEKGNRTGTWEGKLSVITMQAADLLNAEQPTFLQLKKVPKAADKADDSKK